MEGVLYIKIMEKLDNLEFVINIIHCIDVVKYHFGSSLRWVMDENNNIIADKIIKFENIDIELKDLFNKYGYTDEITKNNSTNHKNYREYYNEESIKLVRENFKENIEYFNYEY